MLPKDHCKHLRTNFLSVFMCIIIHCSQVLLKQITTEVEGSGSRGGHLDPALKENLSLFRLTADAMVKVRGKLLATLSVESYCRCHDYQRDNFYVTVNTISNTCRGKSCSGCQL